MKFPPTTWRVQTMPLHSSASSTTLMSWAVADRNLRWGGVLPVVGIGQQLDEQTESTFHHESTLPGPAVYASKVVPTSSHYLSSNVLWPPPYGPTDPNGKLFLFCCEPLARFRQQKTSPYFSP